MVFQETSSQRLDRCKRYQLERNPTWDEYSVINKQISNLKHLLRENNIDIKEFAQTTYNHFHGKTEKKILPRTAKYRKNDDYGKLSRSSLQL